MDTKPISKAIIKLTLIDIFPSITDLNNDTSPMNKLQIIFHGINIFYNLEELIINKKEILINQNPNQNLVNISIIRNTDILANGKFLIKQGIQWVTFAYENKNKSSNSNCVLNLIDCIKIKFSCEIQKLQNQNEGILKNPRFSYIENEKTQKYIQKTSKNEKNKSKSKFKHNKSQENFNFLNVEDCVFRKTVTNDFNNTTNKKTLNTKKNFKKYDLNSVSKVSLYQKYSKNSFGPDKPKEFFQTYRSNLNNSITNFNSSSKKKTFNKRKLLSSKNDSNFNLDKFLQSKIVEHIVPQEKNNSNKDKNKYIYKTNTLCILNKNININELINQKNDNVPNNNTIKKNCELEYSINSTSEESTANKNLLNQNNEMLTARFDDTNNENDNNLFNKLKNDFFLVYNSDYIKNIKEDLLKLEIELFFEKTVELINAYHSKLDDFNLEHDILRSNYKNNVMCYLEINKLICKFNFISKSFKAKKLDFNKDKKNVKMFQKNNLNANQNEFKLFQVLFNNKKNNEEEKKKLKSILGGILKRNKNINIDECFKNSGNSNVSEKFINKLIKKINE